MSRETYVAWVRGVTRSFLYGGSPREMPGYLGTRLWPGHYTLSKVVFLRYIFPKTLVLILSTLLSIAVIQQTELINSKTLGKFHTTSNMFPSEEDIPPVQFAFLIYG
jgi:hypothetical protein